MFTIVLPGPLFLSVSPPLPWHAWPAGWAGLGLGLMQWTSLHCHSTAVFSALRVHPDNDVATDVYKCTVLFCVSEEDLIVCGQRILSSVYRD